MKIRRAKPSDAKEISILRRKTIEKINSKDYPKSVIKFLKRKNSESEILKRIKERELFVAIEDKKIIGTADLEGNKIGGVFIRTDRIGKGIGKKLMQFIENYAKKKGIKKLKLYPTRTAHDFYIKLGYKVTKKGLWKTKDFRIKNYMMEKRMK